LKNFDTIFKKTLLILKNAMRS